MNDYDRFSPGMVRATAISGALTGYREGSRQEA
jgi:hypothetical protein